MFHDFRQRRPPRFIQSFNGKVVEKFLKKSCCETAEKAIKTYNSDILRIGKKAQNGFYYDFEKIKDWHEALQYVKLDFSVKANFVRS